MVNVDLDAPVKLDERQVIGKGMAGLRRDGLVPAVIHNHGQASIHVMGPEMHLTSIYQKAGKHHPLNLTVGDQKFLALIKDADIHPVKRRLQHLVFQAIRQDEKVEATVPVHLEGEIPAEKVGLMILHQLDEVEIEALPRDLPDVLKVDASKLVELHDKIMVSDVQVPSGVTIITEAEHPIATVVETPAQESEEAAEADEEATEGEGAEAGQASDNAEAEPAGQEAPKE